MIEDNFAIKIFKFEPNFIADNKFFISINAWYIVIAIKLNLKQNINKKSHK